MQLRERMEMHAIPFLQEVFGGCQNVALHVVPRNVIKHSCREGPSVRGGIVLLWARLRGDKGTKTSAIVLYL